MYYDLGKGPEPFQSAPQALYERLALGVVSEAVKPCLVVDSVALCLRWAKDELMNIDDQNE